MTDEEAVRLRTLLNVGLKMPNFETECSNLAQRTAAYVRTVNVSCPCQLDIVPTADMASPILPLR
jgi:hypothetical protein